MDVLVIGGTYFAGRVFTLTASRREDMSLTLLNRGRYSLDRETVREIRCDRHDTETLGKALKDTRWDAVADFCAYEPGDVRSIFRVPGFHAEHYLLLSTSSVCDCPPSEEKTEESPVLTASDGTRDGEYAYKKALLEAELKEECGKCGTAYTIFRPAFIYGPYNYAERESWFIRLIAQGTPIPDPVEAAARFRFVYVGDVAAALQLCLADRRARGRTYHLAGPETLDYPSFFSVLETCSDRPVAYMSVTAQEILRRSIPMPFPIFRDDLCSGKRISEELGFRYVPFQEGMKKTWKAFMQVYSSALPASPSP